MEAAIQFYSRETVFSLADENRISSWLHDAVISESQSIADLTYVFCSDDYLLEINQKFLQHDTYTDVITFDYTNDPTIPDEQMEGLHGEVLISIDRVRENASEFNVAFDHELYRVMIHGVLHLLGYNDKTEEEVNVIRSKEDYYLERLDLINR